MQRGPRGRAGNLDRHGAVARARGHGAGGQPVQAPRLHLPVERDLRRLPVDLRLRPPRRADAAQREGRLVAHDGAAPRRRRRSRRGHPLEPPHLGGVGPPRELHGPLGRLQGVQGALAARRAGGPRRVPELRRPQLLHRGPPVQPDVQDLRRAGGGRRRGGLPPPGDGPGHVRELPQRAPDRPQAAAVRHRPDRQELPQRDHHRELRVPYPRVRADGAGVLRPAGPGRGVVPVLVRGAPALVPGPRHPRRAAAAAASRDGRAVPLLVGHIRCRVPVPVGVGRAGGHRQPDRLRPVAALGRLGREARVLRPGHG